MKKRNDHFVRITAAAVGALLVLTACGGPALPAPGGGGGRPAQQGPNPHPRPGPQHPPTPF